MMLVKIKIGDRTIQFNSRENPIAILLTPGDREAIDRMAPSDQLFLSAPPSTAQGPNGIVDIWKWAYEDWEGATLVADPAQGRPVEIVKG